MFAQNVVTSSRKRGSFLDHPRPGESHRPGEGHRRGAQLRLPARPRHHRLVLRRRLLARPSSNCATTSSWSEGGIGEEDGKGGADEGGNVYQGHSRRFKLGPRSIIADPRFRSREDLHLSPGSPAFGRALKLGPEWFGGAALARDLSGAPLPAAPAAGAYQK